MIARIWRAEATHGGAAAYTKHFNDSVLPSLRALPGHRHAYLLNRDAGEGITEIHVISLWESLDAIRAFTGDGQDLTTAIVEPEAQAVLTDYERTVRHHEVMSGAEDSLA